MGVVNFSIETVIAEVNGQQSSPPKVHYKITMDGETTTCTSMEGAWDVVEDAIWEAEKELIGAQTSARGT